MTEILSMETPAPSAWHSGSSAARLKARYRAERRFRLYGLCAIVLTAAFLGVLLLDIVVKGLPAFTQHKLVLDVPVPAGTSATPEALRSADLTTPVRDALRSLFPDASERKRRKALTGLLSSGAGDDLRRILAAEPALARRTVRTTALLSDEADLYLKGGAGRLNRIEAGGAATIEVLPGEVVIRSTAEDFAAAVASFRAAIAVQRDTLAVETRRLERALAEAAEADGRKSIEDKIATLKTRMDAYDKRLSDAGGGLDLDETVPTVLAEVGGGIIKIHRLAVSEASGTPLVPIVTQARAPAGTWQLVTLETPEANRATSDQEIAWLEQLRQQGRIERSFNWGFFTSGDSREPELAGIRGALVGSILTLLVTLLLCLPIGVAAAVYLEEFAPKNRLTDLIEVNINNLAAVPSIVFGLLGLAVFLNFFGLPRSAPLVGGLVLALLVLPTIIIASRAALKAVPPSIKEAALGVGASHQQAVFHHVLPLALPGIMTGTIIGMAHALGETAPLLMIGMVAFIIEVPDGLTSAATVLPVQIYLSSDLPEVAFQSKTAAAIIVLLAVLFVMNGAAIYLRRRFERRW